jgi:hypothetical protein
VGSTRLDSSEPHADGDLLTLLPGHHAANRGRQLTSSDLTESGESAKDPGRERPL